MNGSSGSFEWLASRVDELEKRVRALEHPDEDRSPLLKPIAVPLADPRRRKEAPLQTANVFPVLGGAMLGIAGAYLLRAIAEAGFIPRVAVAAVAIAYAFAWLVWAARVSKVSKFVSLVYSGTSVAILAPMLWEITLHFHVFVPAATAGVLAAFVTLATVLGFRDGSPSFVWIAQGAGTMTAIVLAFATHNIMPFLFMLLIALAVVECARSLNYTQPAWSLIALITDAAVWGAIFIYSGPPNARAEFPELGNTLLVLPACLLFAINLIAVSVRALVQQKSVSLFEIIQIMIAFGIAISSVLLFVPNAVIGLGVVCTIMSAAAYFASFRYLRPRPAVRNFRIFGAWSAALLVAGAMWMLPNAGAGIALAVAASGAYILATRMNSKISAAHGALFLCVAAILSGVPRYIFNALASSLDRRPSPAVWVVACCAVAAYAIGRDDSADEWALQSLHLVPAFIAASAICALLVQGALAVSTLNAALNPHHIAFLRTLVISALSLGLAYAGSRWRRVALARLAYFALAFIAAKLLFEDLRHGHMEFIAASIFLFALTLIAVPRLVRRGAMSNSKSNAETPVHAGR